MQKVIGTAPYQVPTNADLGTMAFQDASAVSVDLLQVDNIRIDGNVVSSTDTNGNITLTPNGTGIVSVSSSLTVAGNLTVNGTTTTTNSTTVTVDDPIFTLGGDTAPAADDNKDRGVEFRWHNGTAAKLGFFGYDDSAAEFTFIPDATNSSEVFSGTAGNVRFGTGVFEGNVTLGDAVGDTVTINGTATFSNANPTLTAGTANGVTYLNASKVLTSGTALTFDATTLVAAAAAARIQVSPSTNTNNSLFQATNAGGSGYFGLDNSAGNLSGAAYALALWHNSNYPIIFGVNNAAQMRLNATGLGIGTTDPNQKLVVSNGGAAGLEIGPTILNSAPALVSYNRSAGATIQLSYIALSHVWHSGSSPTETMRHTTTGLGIGATPDASLHVYSGSAQAIKFTQAAGGTRVLLGNQDSGGANTPAIIASSNSDITIGKGSTWAGDGGTFTSRTTFKGDTGNIGVGNTSPQYKIDVNTGATASSGIAASFGASMSAGYWTGIHFGYLETNNTNYRKTALIFERQDSSARGKIHILNNGDSNSNSASLSDSRITILFNGNTGVGTTDPGARLETVAGTPSTDLALSIRSNTRLVSPDGTKIMSMRMLDSDVLAFSGGAGQLFSISDSMTGTIFAVNDVSGMPSIEVFDSGKVQIAELTGNVLIGTSVDTGFKLRVNGTSHITQLGVGSSNNTNFDFYNNGTSYFNGAVTVDDILTISGGISASGGIFYFRNDAGVDVTNAGQINGLQVFQPTAGADALMSFHISLDHAVHFGLDGDTNDLTVGGWSMGANKYKVWHAGNHGSGSNLDADLLDGQHGSYYLNTSTSFGGDVSGTYNAIVVADNSHNHTSLTGVTSIAFAAMSSDTASISTTVGASETYFDFNLSDDNNNDWWRWRFTPSGSSVYDAMTLKPSANGVADLAIPGAFSLQGSITYNDVSRYWLATATNWGIYWDTTDNRIEFHGSGNDRWGVDLDNGNSDQAGTITADSAEFTGLGTNGDPGTDDLYVGGYGIQGSRNGGPVYIHNHSTGGVRISGNATLGTANGILVEANQTTVNGLLTATTKSFTIPHPTKPGKKLRYGSLEGPENGVYVRGKLKGGNVIELPEYWTKLVDQDSITVQLTPIGKHQKLYVEDVRDNKVYVANDSMFGGEINCFYYVQGERVDVDKLEVECD